MIRDLHTDIHKNRVSFSAFQKFEGTTRFNEVAAKFVLSGEETYYLQRRKFTVKKGEYIIGNGGHFAEVEMKSPTSGLCLDISHEVIKEVADLYFEQSDFIEFLLGDAFLINTYKTQNTSLGLQLQSLVLNRLQADKTLESNLFTEELFLSLGESIVLDQSKVFGELSKLKFKKRIVSDENYRRLSAAKDFIDEEFTTDISVENLTQIACMSKFNFIRLFKLSFGISPYRYLLSRRLNYAKALILNGEKVTEVAFKTGFADVAAFSKAFKAQFSVAPSKLR